MGANAIVLARHSDARIDICGSNPRYWQVNGRPTLLLGGSVEDNPFQLSDAVEHLQLLANCGGNYIRCTMSCRDEGNVWPFGRVGDRYDLNTWNDEFWQRFEVFLSEAHRLGIIVQVELWATFDYYRDSWAANPFNPRNNVNYTARETGLPDVVTTHPTKTENSFFWSVPTENNQQTVLHYQQRFVERILEHTLPRGNVLYCMDNETSVTAEWGAYWAAYVRAAADRAGVIVHTTEMWDPWDLNHPMHCATFDHPEIFTFVDISQNNHNSDQEHYDGAMKARVRTATMPRPLNNVKIYGADGGRFGSTRDGIERFWRNIFVGMASARFHRPGSGIGLNERAQRMIRSAREVTDALRFERCEPRNDLLSERSENEAYCFAELATQYAVYFPDAGSVLLDASAATGPMAVRWYNLGAGGWQPADRKNPERVRLTTPGKGQWVVVLSVD